MKSLVLVMWCAAIAAAAPATGQRVDTLHVYGPGGPLPAMEEAAAEFGRVHGIVVDVTGGPTSGWLDKAKRDADVIFSGSEHMMTDFIRQLESGTAGRIVEATVTPMYLRASAILVRKGNPKNVRTFPDLTRPGVKVLVVQGAGQSGMWEDIAGRTGDIDVVRAFRRNIGAFAPNSGEAKKIWTDDKTYDAWLIYTIWQVANRDLADLVEMRDPWVIYRGAGIALTAEGQGKRHAREFREFLLSPAGAHIFAKWGWITGERAGLGGAVRNLPRQ